MSRKKQVVIRVPLTTLYRISGEPENDVHRQELWPTRAKVDCKNFTPDELSAARERGWFSAETVNGFLTAPAADAPDEMPRDDKSALVKWALDHRGITLDKRKSIDRLIEEVEAAQPN